MSPASSLLSAIKSQLTKSGLLDTDRSLNVGSLVSGGLDKLGYIPLSSAVGQCEGLARNRGENTFNRNIVTDRIPLTFLLVLCSG